MARISKRKLKKEVFDKINKRFVDAIVSLNNESGGSAFFGEFFSSAERTMFAKRFAALFMLTHGMSSYKVGKLLNMSYTTTARLSLGLSMGKYTHIKNLTTKRKERKAFVDELEVFLRCGMPSMGKDRWKWLDELYGTQGGR